MLLVGAWRRLFQAHVNQKYCFLFRQKQSQWHTPCWPSPALQLAHHMLPPDPSNSLKLMMRLLLQLEATLHISPEQARRAESGSLLLPVYRLYGHRKCVARIVTTMCFRDVVQAT